MHLPLDYFARPLVVPTLEHCRRWVLPLGIHQGKTLAEVARIDRPYLIWLAERPGLLRPDFLAALNQVLSEPSESAPIDPNQTILKLQ